MVLINDSVFETVRESLPLSTEPISGLSAEEAQEFRFGQVDAIVRLVWESAYHSGQRDATPPVKEDLLDLDPRGHEPGACHPSGCRCRCTDCMIVYRKGGVDGRLCICRACDCGETNRSPVRVAPVPEWSDDGEVDESRGHRVTAAVADRILAGGFKTISDQGLEASEQHD